MRSPRRASPQRAAARRVARCALAVLAAIAASCSHAGDGVEARGTTTTVPSTTEPSTTDAPMSTPTVQPAETTTSVVLPPSGDAAAPDTSAGPVQGRDLSRDPFTRPVGRGLVAPAPPPGALVDGGAAAEGRPALLVKIDNSTDAWPQVGLNHADIVFEELVEGISRFAAAFASEDAAVVGPVRSARTSDIALLSMFGRPCFGFSGGNSGVVSAVNASPLISVSAEVAGGAYWRAEDREIPHNLMTSTAALRSACAGSTSSAALPLFAYAATTAATTAVDIGGVDIEIGASRSQFVWDAEAGRWLRYAEGAADIDPDGVQISPTNVVVLDTAYLPSAADSRSPEAQTLGSGAAYLLTGGSVVAGTWQRTSAGAAYRLTGPDGQPLRLRPGRTWVELPPRGGGFRFFGRDEAAAILTG